MTPSKHIHTHTHVQTRQVIRTSLADRKRAYVNCRIREVSATCRESVPLRRHQSRVHSLDRITLGWAKVDSRMRFMGSSIISWCPLGVTIFKLSIDPSTDRPKSIGSSNDGGLAKYPDPRPPPMWWSFRLRTKSTSLEAKSGSRSTASTLFYISDSSADSNPLPSRLNKEPAFIRQRDETQNLSLSP